MPNRRPAGASGDPGSVEGEAAESIARIMAIHDQLAYFFAFDRSDPLFETNLTMSQLKIMLALAMDDNASGQDLARIMHVSLATITGIVDRLTTQGMVARHEDPRDRRVRRVELTADGRKLIDGILTAGAEHQRRLLERLDRAALDTVERASHLLLAAAEAELAELEPAPTGQSARTCQT